MNGRRINRFKGLIVLLAIVTGGVISPASASAQATAPASWSTTPSMSTMPSYQFRSTSVYQPIVGQTPYTSTSSYAPFPSSAPNRARQSWNDPDDNELGTVDDPLPIGEPIVLFLMAFLYFIWKKMSKNSKKMQKNLVMSKKSSTFAPAFPK